MKKAGRRPAVSPAGRVGLRAVGFQCPLYVLPSVQGSLWALRGSQWPERNSMSPGHSRGTGQARTMPAFIFQSNQAPPPGEGSPRTGGARGRGGLAGAARQLSPLLLLFDFHTCCFRDVSFWGCAGLTAKSGRKSRASTQSPALTQTPPPTSRTSPASVTRPADPCGHAAGPRMA